MLVTGKYYRPPRVALIGNTNTGKTHSFNELFNIPQPDVFKYTIGFNSEYYTIKNRDILILDIGSTENVSRTSESCKDINVFVYYPTLRPQCNSDPSDSQWYTFMKNTSPNAQIIIYNNNLPEILNVAFW
jgi:hypothetical protein